MDERKRKADEQEQSQRGTDYWGAEAGGSRSISEDVARDQGVSKHTIYAWKSKYGGMEVSEAQEVKQLREESLLAARVRRRRPASVLYPVYPACYSGIGEMDSGGPAAPLGGHRTGEWNRRESAPAPFYAGEIFRERESRRRIFLTFLMSLSTTVGGWSISSWLPTYAQKVAEGEGYANTAQWGTLTALLYTSGAIVAYTISGFVIDAIGRRKFLFVTFLGALVITPITFLWVHSVEALTLVATINGFFTLGCAYTWMAIYPAELFTSAVRCTAVSFIFNGTRMVAWIFPIIAGNMIQRFGGIPRAAVTLGTVYAMGLVGSWLVPETRGMPLPK